MRYYRKDDLWVCPSCESENLLSQGACTACGERKSASCRVLPKWDREREMRSAYTAPPKAEPARREPAMREAPRCVPDEGNSNKGVIIACVFMGLLVLSLILAIALS